MSPANIIFFTALIEAGLSAALLYRRSSRKRKPTEGSYPHFKATTKKFYRSRQQTNGTWEIE